MSYLLDTNIVSEWVKPRPNPNVVGWLQAANEDEVFISVCTLAELRFGIAWMPKGRRRDLLDTWLSVDLPMRFDSRIVPIDSAIADSWGRLQAYGKKGGRNIDTMDGLIAATAETYQMTVVTRDVADFEVLGISWLNPWAA